MRRCGHSMLRAATGRLLIFGPESQSSRARVAVWREIRRLGALHLQQSVVAFPDTPEFRSAVESFRAIVDEVGGETLTIGGEPLDQADGGRLRERWNVQRDAEYRAVRTIRLGASPSGSQKRW